MQLTVVVPTEKLLPLGGMHTGAGAPPSQRSAAVAAGYATIACPLPVHSAVIDGGQLIAGGVVSRTITLNEQLAAFPEKSATAQLTGVLPTVKLLPEGGLQIG